MLKIIMPCKHDVYEQLYSKVREETTNVNEQFEPLLKQVFKGYAGQKRLDEQFPKGVIPNGNWRC